MNRSIALGIAMLAGGAIGATAIQGLHAQAKPQSLVVVDISDITNPDGFKGVAQGSPERTAAMQKFGGHYIARTQKITSLDGTPPKRFIIIAFDSLEKAQAWNNSPTQTAVNDTRNKTTKSRSFIVEGMAN